ncbi:MAG: hypothetical protein IJT60_02825 [Clostridia bacterium]|nr:hypothetical protein [Clostridia bacterium]
MKQFLAILLAGLFLLTLCACGTEPATQETQTTGSDETEQDVVDMLTPFTLKETHRLVVGDETFDLKTVIELKSGHTIDEVGMQVVSDETVASVDANGIVTRLGYGQVSINIFVKSNSVVFNVFNLTFAPANLYGTEYKGGFKKADGTLGNEISLQLNSDNTFTLKVGEGKARYMDVDYDVDSKAVGEFTGTFAIDPSSGTPLTLTSEAYSSEGVKGAFGKTESGAFCVRVKLFTVTVEGELKSVVTELTAG